MNVIRFNWLLNRYKYDREAVQELYECYYPWIVRYINRQFRGMVDGRDIAQQFFLKLFSCKSNRIRAPNDWVRTGARNLAIDILRKNGNRKKAEMLAAVPEEIYLPGDIPEAFACLTDEEKQVIYLRYWERYKLKEIAEFLQIQYGRVKTIHATAKRKIRKEMNQEKYNEKL